MEVLDIRFRSVVQTAILAERPATLTIILMARLVGIVGTLMQFPNKTRTGPTVRVNGIQSEEAVADVRVIG